MDEPSLPFSRITVTWLIDGGQRRVYVRVRDPKGSKVVFSDYWPDFMMQDHEHQISLCLTKDMMQEHERIIANEEGA